MDDTNVLKEAAEKLSRIGDSFDLLDQLVAQATRAFTDFATSSFSAGLFSYAGVYKPRWWHLFKYSKKFRIRKKYYRKLLKYAEGKRKEVETWMSEDSF